MKQAFLDFANTPLLWQKKQFGLAQFDIQPLTTIDFTPEAIPAQLRLGHQVEHIFNQLLRYTSKYTVLAKGVQIKRHKQTLGELDFLLSENDSKRLLHIELTYKFYLIDPDISEPIHRLVGPNRNDMFFTKMEKIKQQQLPLIHTPEGQETLQQLQLEVDQLEQYCCFKAQLFKPYAIPSPVIRPLNTDCIIGYWLRFEDFKGTSFKTAQYYIPYKYEWLHTPHKKVEWLSFFEVQLEINIKHLNQFSPMIWKLDTNGHLQKLFVVWW